MSEFSAEMRVSWRLSYERWGESREAARILVLLDALEAAERERDEAQGERPSGFWSQREWEDWSNDLAGLILEGDEAKYSNPEGAQEGIIEDCLRAYSTAEARFADLMARVGALADEFQAGGVFQETSWPIGVCSALREAVLGEPS